MQKRTDALILAAGLGARMLPLTEKYAKPLVPVRGTTMIETVIGALNEQNVSRIFVVVGYKKEQFEFLTSKYQNVRLIENKEYREKNNVSSVMAAADLLGDNDCFVCEADLFISDPSVLSGMGNRSCYFGRYVKGRSADWVFVINDGRITEIRKGGDDLYNMTGVSFWTKRDLRILLDAVRRAYGRPGHENLFWDEVANTELEMIRLSVHPVDPDQMAEIDTVAELEEFIRRTEGPELKQDHKE